jgi:hypothetical protein
MPVKKLIKKKFRIYEFLEIKKLLKKKKKSQKNFIFFFKKKLKKIKQ